MHQSLFYKFHGLGNDFIFFDEREKRFSVNSHLIKKLCHRHIGIGADGVAFLSTSKKADFAMRIFNSDGSEAQSCINALRCFFYFLYKLGYDKKRYRIELKHEIVEGIYDSGFSTLFLPRYPIQEKNLSLTIDNKKFSFYQIHSGVHHVVCFDEKIDNLKNFGKKIRYHKLFAPQGTNVNFAQRHSYNEIFVKTYEKGVENVTKACGTGAVATALAAVEYYSIKGPIKILFIYGCIEINFSLNNNESISLKGPCNFVYSGRININSFLN